MKNDRLSITFFLSILMSMTCYGQCDFKTFVNTYFDVYESSDSLIEWAIYEKGAHKWQLKESGDNHDCAVEYFPSQNWYSACAYHIKNCYVLRFWDEIYTDTALINNTTLLLCNEKGEIIDKVILSNTNIEYADVSKKSVWSQFYLLENKIIWRLYEDTENGEYIEKQLRIQKSRIHQSNVYP